jgi:hypothetical protein
MNYLSLLLNERYSQEVRIIAKQKNNRIQRSKDLMQRRKELIRDRNRNKIRAIKNTYKMRLKNKDLNPEKKSEILSNREEKINKLKMQKYNNINNLNNNVEFEKRKLKSDIELERNKRIEKMRNDIKPTLKKIDKKEDI